MKQQYLEIVYNEANTVVELEPEQAENTAHPVKYIAVADLEEIPAPGSIYDPVSKTFSAPAQAE